MIRRIMNLQLFADGGNSDPGNQGGSAGGSGNGGQEGNAGSSAARFSFEQADEIANARAQRAEKSALKSYFTQQGMTEEEAAQAIEEYKRRKQANQPNISALEKERDDALGKLAQYENEKTLTSKGVKAEDLDYVLFKVNQLVTDKKDFKAAASEFIKENPTDSGQGYKVSTGVPAGGYGGTESKNEAINNMIRSAAGR